MEKPKVVNLHLSPDMLARIEEFRYSERIPTRMDAIRLLIERGLPQPKVRQKKTA